MFCKNAREAYADPIIQEHGWQPRGQRRLRTLGNLSLLVISSEFLFVVLNYFFCALVSPDFEAGETHDLRLFHECESPTYILVFAAIVAIAII